MILPTSPMTACACSMVDGADTFYTDWEETYESFDQMNLHENLLRGIYAYGELLLRGGGGRESKEPLLCLRSPAPVSVYMQLGVCSLFQPATTAVCSKG